MDLPNGEKSNDSYIILTECQHWTEGRTDGNGKSCTRRRHKTS